MVLIRKVLSNAVQRGMKVVVPHPADTAGGIERVKALLLQHKDKIAEHATDIRTDWHGNVLQFGFTSQGQWIDGALTVRDREYEIDVRLPLALRLFEGTIERMIREEVHKLTATG